MSHSEKYLSGAATIARHLSYTEKVTLASIIGNEEKVRLRMDADIRENCSLRNDESKIIAMLCKFKDV